MLSILAKSFMIATHTRDRDERTGKPRLGSRPKHWPAHDHWKRKGPAHKKVHLDLIIRD